MDLLVLRKLLLSLSNLGLKSRLLQNLRLLVCVDDPGGNQLIKRLASVLAEKRIGL